uniref:synaptonemal complex central element protein 3 n=1 Tax=Panthera onca TaxID=9690 RepID=UPI0029541DF8|nr:synaptonemal complex central element protein 3 [Panthera onca]
MGNSKKLSAVRGWRHRALPGVLRATAPFCSLTGAHLVVAVQATWMAYDMVVMRTDPTLAESVRRLEDAFLNCKEEMEKNWQELLTETKHKQ